MFKCRRQPRRNVNINKALSTIRAHKESAGVALMLLLSLAIRIPNVLRGYFSGPHQGRQIQTLWPVHYWLDHGFSPFHSHFIVHGKLQVWDMEFPIYQWITFGISKYLNLNLVIASKILTLVVTTASAWFVYKLAGLMGLTSFGKLTAAAIFSISPRLIPGSGSERRFTNTG